jgi:transcriptional regulator with XRE-family HTH domain
MKDETMSNKRRLGWYIKIARTERRLSQDKLAKKIGTKQESIARAENKGCELSFAEKCVEACGFEISNIALRNKNPFESGLQFYA